MNNFLDKARAVGQVLRLLDEQGRVSLTNAALIAMVVKLLLTPNLALPDLVAFIGTLASYQAKRFIQGAAADPSADTDELKAAVAALQSKVTAVQLQVGVKVPQR